MDATKTTFYLPDALRTRLKVLAARKGTSVTTLLTEGACLVVARYEGASDREELERRATAARERLRRGLYEGPPISDSIDEIVYESRRRGAARRSSR